MTESTPRNVNSITIAHAGGADDIYVLTREHALRVTLRSRGAMPAQVNIQSTLPPDIVNFAGRDAEIHRLAKTIAHGSVAGSLVAGSTIDGMPGVGKTALAVHAAHMLAPDFPDGQFFVSLHAHTPGHDPAHPDDVLSELLLKIGVDPGKIPVDLEEKASLWRDQLSGKRLLLVLDDADSRHQVEPIVPGAAGCAVLITSRDPYRSDNTAPLALDVLPADQAAEMLSRLGGRTEASYPAAIELVRLAGCLPLAIRLVAGSLHRNQALTLTDLIDELSEARDRSAAIGALDELVSAAFDVSYNRLPSRQQRLFRCLGLHSGYDIEIYSATALADLDLHRSRAYLDALNAVHLVEKSGRDRYRMHNMIGDYAHALAKTDPVEGRVAALGRLLSYYLYTAQAANRYLSRRTRAGDPKLPGAQPSRMPEISTREQATAWLEAERINLHAITEYAATHHQPDYAIAIPEALHEFLARRGYWEQALTLDQIALATTRETNDQFAEAAAVHYLGTVQRWFGEFSEAIASQEESMELYRKLGSRRGQADALNELGLLHRLRGDYSAAILRQQAALQLYRALDDRHGQANSFNDLGHVRAQMGDYRTATQDLTQALELYREHGDKLGEAWALSELGVVRRQSGDPSSAAAIYPRVIEIYRSLGDEANESNALIELGVAQRDMGDYPTAIETHLVALRICRNFSFPSGESWALKELGITQGLAGDHQSASASLTRSLELCRVTGNRFREAETLNSLGELSLTAASYSEALDYFQQARALTDLFPMPPEEARSLEGIGRYYLHDGQVPEAVSLLRQALTIYKKLNSVHAERVEMMLLTPGLQQPPTS